MKTEIFPLFFDFPPGQYWIGDLGYIYPDEHWQEYVGLIYSDGSSSRGLDINGCIVRIDGNKYLFVSATAYGDGEYSLLKNDKYAGSLPVDSGCLAIVPLELAESWKTEDNNFNLGIVVEWRGGQVKSHDGNFEFGKYSVNTKD